MDDRINIEDDRIDIDDDQMVENLMDENLMDEPMNYDQEIEQLEQWVNLLNTRADAHASDPLAGQDREFTANNLRNEYQILRAAITGFRETYDRIRARERDENEMEQGDNTEDDKKELKREILAFKNANVNRIEALLDPNGAAQQQQARGGRRLRKRGQESRRRSSSARKSSSRRGRRSAKKRGTQRKQKRRQRRASRRAY